MGDIAYNESFSQLPEVKGLSLLRSNTVQILLFIFIATLFYSKSEEYKVFRIVYSIFLYLSLLRGHIFSHEQRDLAGRERGEGCGTEQSPGNNANEGERISYSGIRSCRAESGKHRLLLCKR